MTQSAPITADAPPVVSDLGASLQVVEASRREIVVHQRREHHRWMLGMSLFIISASFLLRISDTGSVNVSWLNFSLPPLCGSRALFNVECPGCGLTRSFVALAAGDFEGSIRYHRVGWLFALAVVAQIPYRLFALRELRANKISERTWPFWFGNLLIALLIANWLLKISGLA